VSSDLPYVVHKTHTDEDRFTGPELAKFPDKVRRLLPDANRFVCTNSPEYSSSTILLPPPFPSKRRLDVS
jgi:hypothetical protein